MVKSISVFDDLRKIENAPSQEVDSLLSFSPKFLETSSSQSHSSVLLRTWEPSHTQNSDKEWEHLHHRVWGDSLSEPSSWVFLFPCTSQFYCGFECLAREVSQSRSRGVNNLEIQDRLFCTVHTLHEKRYWHSEQFLPDSFLPLSLCADQSWGLCIFWQDRNQWCRLSCGPTHIQSWSCSPWCLCVRTPFCGSARVVWLSECQYWKW